MFKVACIQICSNNDIKENLDKVLTFVKQSISNGAEFILTPEVTSLFFSDKLDLLSKISTMQEDIFVKEFKRICKESNKWILLGSLLIKQSKNSVVNRSILINSSGEIEKFYDKIHMFDVILSEKEKYNESTLTDPGKSIVLAKLPLGKLGMSICYDMRYPNMYRSMSKSGASFISIPSAFTFTTGQKHWHALLKARAIENFSYIFAPAQCGVHFNGRKTFGHSLIISPDGEILNEIQNEEGVIISEIDPNLPFELRKKIPSLNSD